MRGYPFRFTLMILLLLVVASGAVGQSLTGAITGVVKDQTDAVIPGAVVSAIEQATGREFRTTSDSQGNFTFASLPNGLYRVSIEAQGFAKFTVERLQVQTSQTSTVTAKLELAKTGAEIVVTSEQNVVDVDSPELKATIERAQIMNLPLPTRNPLDLVRTMPGITTPANTSNAFVHGLRGNATHLTQDGINVADNTVKTSTFFVLTAPTVDSTGEFSVSTGAIGTDAGVGAAQVSIRTQRGGNDFHGSLFWFQRTSAFNANPWFNGATNTPTPFQLQNRIGAQAGGPIVIPKLYDGRNKTWVFGLYEAFREPRSQARTRSVMTSTARAGMFTYKTCPTTACTGPTNTVDLLSLGTVGNTGNTPMINPATMNFYNSLVPTDGLTDQGCTSDTFNIRCFTFNLAGKSQQDRYVIRFDHQLSKNHSLEFVWTRSNFDTSPDFLNGIEPTFPGAPGGGQDSIRELYVWAWQSTWGSNKTNELRGGLTRAPVNFRLDNDYGTSGGFQIDYTTVSDPTLVQTNLPQGRNTPVRQIMDNFSWVMGRHTLRFGGEYQLILADNYFFNTVVPRIILGSNSSNPNGITSSDFTGGISSGDLSRAQAVFNNIVGLVNAVNQGFNHTSPTSGFVAGQPRLTRPIQATESLYIQDSFKWRPNVTLTMGVRYEYHGVFDLRNGLILQPVDGIQGLWGPSQVGSLFNPTTTPVQSDVMLDFAGGRNGRPIYGSDGNNFAPFAGFAWDPWKNGKTSIRGGGSVHFTQDGFTVGNIASTGNTGLFNVLSACNTAGPNCTSAGVATGALDLSNVPTPATPTAAFPVSQRGNFNSAGASLWVFDPKLATPYVLEWTLSVQRELWNRISVEARYVGNHAVKQLRSFSLNEINLLNSPFTCVAAACAGQSVANILTEFQNAQFNQQLCGTSFSPTCAAGAMPLPLLSTLFQGVSNGSAFGSSSFITQLQQNQIGGMFDTLRRSNTYRANRENLANGIPLNYFVANPWANGANLVGNPGFSYYHGLELEIRRRFSTGLFFQGNYTWSKVLTDVRFQTSQQENQNYLFLANMRRDKNPAAFDIRQSFRGNFIYALPFGRGKWIGANVNGAVDKLIGGWQLQGLTTIQSGTPFNITSPRNILGSGQTSTAVLQNMTAEKLQQNIGVFYRPEGVYWLNPDSGLVSIAGSGSTAVACTRNASGVLTTTTPCLEHPGANTLGNLPFFGLTGPMFWVQDFSVIKRTSIPVVSEQFNFEIRFEMFNVFNHPNFSGESSSIDASNFGRLTSQVDTARGGGVQARLIQWAIRVNW